MKYFLQDGDRVFTTGTFLVYDQEQNKFVFDELDDDTYFEGECMEWEEVDGVVKPYVEKE